MFADSKKKVFVNICHSDAVEKATSSHSVDGLKRGQRWKIPYSLSKPREDLDKGTEREILKNVGKGPGGGGGVLENTILPQ